MVQPCCPLVAFPPLLLRLLSIMLFVLLQVISLEGHYLIQYRNCSFRIVDTYSRFKEKRNSDRLMWVIEKLTGDLRDCLKSVKRTGMWVIEKLTGFKINSQFFY